MSFTCHLHEAVRSRDRGVQAGIGGNLRQLQTSGILGINTVVCQAVGARLWLITTPAGLWRRGRPLRSRPCWW